VYNSTVLLTIILSVAATGYYLYCIKKRKADPSLTAWMLVTAMMCILSWMYLHSPRKSWTSNISMLFGTANVTVVLAVVLYTNIRRGTLRVAFDTVQKWCLAGGGVIAASWYYMYHVLGIASYRMLLLAYCTVQLLGVVAYTAMVQKLLRTRRNSEPLFTWVVWLLGNFISIYPAWYAPNGHPDEFALIYLLRVIPLNTFLVFLKIHIERTDRKT